MFEAGVIQLKEVEFSTIAVTTAFPKRQNEPSLKPFPRTIIAVPPKDGPMDGVIDAKDIGCKTSKVSEFDDFPHSSLSVETQS